MTKPLLIASLGLLLGGCLASGPRIDGDETYQGPLIAAITPIGGEVDQLTGWLLKHELEEELAQTIEATGIFSAVYPIAAATAPNEAEVIIEPSFVQQTAFSQSAATGRPELGIHLRVWSKTKATTEIDKDYRVSCVQCAFGRLDATAMKELTAAIEEDLSRKFKRKAVR